MKKIIKYSLAFLYFFSCFSLLFIVNAKAYIDPSAMTYIIQLVAGTAIAAGAAFGFYFRKIKRAFSKFMSRDKKGDNWKYDKDDKDDFGYGDYPCLPEDLWEKDELEPEIEEISLDLIAQKYYDKYDERGYDPTINLEYLKKELSIARAQSKK